MGLLESFFGASNDRVESARDELTTLLPTTRLEVPSAVDPREVTKIALRLKHQVETVVPCQLEESVVTTAHSAIITPAVIQTAKAAGGEENKACIVFCLLVCKKWFSKQAVLELWDAEMHEVRALACEVIAKQIIETEENLEYLLEQVLLKRFSILIDGEPSASANALERAVDLHATTVIGSAGYQKCVNYLWRGWLMQDDEDPARFVPYKDQTNTSYWAHVDPDRMRVPRYQNVVQIVISLAFLGLYTGAINTINPTGDLDVVEGLLYLFTLGFICDECAKFWKVGRFYLSFWNAFNSTLYALLTVSFITRMVALGHVHGNPERERMNRLSYNFLAFTAPMFWARLMLYFDSFRFFGAMLVVTKMMLKESLIFFALLFFVLVGFFQAFIGLDLADRSLDDTNFIVENMIKAVLTSPEFDGFEQFGPPFGIILYYIYAFVIMTILLNILIALFNSAYEDISSNSIDEYMALFAQKTLQFARAPDENVYIAPFNLIEIFCLILPFEWWLPSHKYEKLNDAVMGVIYSPVLVITAYLEQRDARTVRLNRSKGESDEDTVEEWEQLDYKPEQEDEAWARKVRETSPNVEVDGVTVLVKDLKREVLELRKMVASQSNPTGDFDEKKASEGASENDRGNSGFGLHDG